MISAIFIQNKTGDVLVSQIFREEVKPSIYSVFFKKIVTVEAKLLKNPILTIGSTSFTYLKECGLYFVAVSRYNVDVTVILQYLSNLIEIINALISNGNPIFDINIMDNVLPIYEILSLTLDHGYIRAFDTETIQKRIAFTIYQTRKNSIASTDFEVLTDNEELNLLYQIDPLTQFQENEGILQINEFIHVPPKGKIKLIGELLVASRKALSYKIRLDIKGNNIHSIILSPHVKTKTDKLECLRIESVSNVACLLNYHGYCQLNILPIVVTGSMKQIQSNTYYLEVNVIKNKSDAVLNNLTLKIPAPKIDSRVITKFGQVNIEANEENEENVIVWNFSKLSLIDLRDRSEERITIHTNITVDPSTDLGSWLRNRKNTLVTYDFEGYNVGQFNVTSYETDKNISKRYVKKVFLTYEVDI